MFPHLPDEEMTNNLTFIPLFMTVIILYSVHSFGSRRDEDKFLERTFFFEEAGIEITLTSDWFALPPVVAVGKAKRVLVSIRDISRLWVATIPLQVEIDEKNFSQRLAELISSVKKSHPDFEETSAALISGDPARLHLEGNWMVEEVPARVMIEVIPVRGKTALLVLMTQKKNWRTFALLSDRIKNRVVVRQKPLATSFPGVYKTALGKVQFRVELPPQWRRALDAEIDFLRQRMEEEGLYEESSDVSGGLFFVRPGLDTIFPILGFRLVPGSIAVSENNQPNFEYLYRSNLASRGRTLLVHKIGIEKIGGIPSYEVDTTIRREGFDIRQRQYFVPFAGETIIVTLARLDDEGGGVDSAARELLEGIFFGKSVESVPIEAVAVASLSRDPGCGIRWILLWCFFGLGFLSLLLFLSVKLRPWKRTGQRGGENHPASSSKA